jgi:hypothetical protein
MVAAEARLAREAKAMTRREVIVKALAGVITWAVAASVIGVSGSDLQEARRNDRGSGGRVIAKTSAPADA